MSVDSEVGEGGAARQPVDLAAADGVDDGGGPVRPQAEVGGADPVGVELAVLHVQAATDPRVGGDPVVEVDPVAAGLVPVDQVGQAGQAGRRRGPVAGGQDHAVGLQGEVAAL